MLGPYDYNKGHMTKLIESYLNRKLKARVTGGYDFVDRDVSKAILNLLKENIRDIYFIRPLYKFKGFFKILKTFSGTKKFSSSC